MNTFEIHITGEEGVNEEFEKLGIKNIIVELLHPNEKLFRIEYMSSFIKKFKTIHDCRDYVNALCCSLKSKIIRVKIETPFYPEYIDRSLYIESHFKTFNNKHPISRNQKSGKLMSTDRLYYADIKDPINYDLFKSKYLKIGADVELCVYDSFVNEDKDWFDLYKK